MRSTEMYIKIVCFVFLYNTGLGKYATGELIPSHNPLDKPFAELPCLTIGGICAGEYNCPKNSRVPIKGLCPLQQKEGIECCKPENPILRCRSRGGNCESIEDIQCPQFLTVKEATDCGRNEYVIHIKEVVMLDFLDRIHSAKDIVVDILNYITDIELKNRTA
ncbi:unnamed protein product [Arctia plantaginis]|uniref:Uncharacterized protein n=1 Tax=Arctia plantaginis TaxID=874455 RepID=A0A8S0YR69_ARCPL|nr:unnamed protein product [Arctia plantaginis]